MTRRSLSLVALAAALAASAVPAFAATQINDYLSFSGFGTLGVARTSTDDADFIRDAQRAGASRQPTVNVDSDFGMQLTATATPWLSGTVQMLTIERNKNHLSTEAEWAFLKLTPVEGLDIRGGRMTLPMFLVSDSRNVGYANNWLRAPGEVYGLALMSRLNGGDVTYSKSFGSSTLTASAIVGTSEVDVTISPNPYKADNVHGVNLQLETDWATFRVGQVRAHVHVTDLDVLDDYAFTGAGISVDRNNIVAQAEYVMRRSTSASSIVDASGWYALAGYRFGGVLPYASYASTKPHIADAPFHLAGPQKTMAAGLRWDVLKAADIKFQLERIDTDHTQGVSFATAVDKPVTAVSVAADFVF